MSGEAGPAELLLVEVGRMAAAGAAPDRVTATVGAAIAGWAEEADMDMLSARIRVEQVWDSLSKDAADLQEAIADADGGGQALAGAKRSLAALQAAVAALAAAHDRLAA